MKQRASIFLLIVLLHLQAGAQADKYSGTWKAENYPAWDSSAKYSIVLQLAAPERNSLYAALLKIEYKEFSGTYELLLVKKQNGELAIGRNKIQTSEGPFSAGAWTVFLNGTFQLKKDKKGKPVLTARRIASHKYGVTMPSLMNFTEEQRGTALQIKNLLKDEPLDFKKINNDAWKSKAVEPILNPWMSAFYYGIIDTIHVNSREGMLHFSDNNRIDNDSVSVVLNGKTIMENVDLSRQNPQEEIQLDTGMNLLCFFAENYGKTPPNTGKLNLAFGNEKFTINFANKADISSTFIVVKIYYKPEEKNRPNMVGNYSGRSGGRPVSKQITDRALQRETKLVDSIKLGSSQITLAIWDDAVEDGDSISLSINEQWIVQGMAVKKKPQFITVTLEPGQNDIIFVADNLGSIIPNTSILEIIDGRYRKSYDISTNYGLNNLIKIQYDYRGTQ
ncbi:MAG: hypothetical protein WAT19_10235 [Ferruginibacter sp.]